LLRRIWTDPEGFRPRKTSRDITVAAARSFATLAEGLRRRGPARDLQPLEAQSRADDIAHFLSQCPFCFSAEDVGLLRRRMFRGPVNNRRLTTGLANMFTVMRDGRLYGNDDMPSSKGGLFKKIKVSTPPVLDMTELRNAAALNWRAIDVSMFGTSFEHGLHPAKCSQLGARYMDPATIMRIVELVLKRPLLHIWEHTAHEMRGLIAKNTRKGDNNDNCLSLSFYHWKWARVRLSGSPRLCKQRRADGAESSGLHALLFDIAAGLCPFWGLRACRLRCAHTPKPSPAPPNVSTTCAKPG